jgi:RyR domain-containing protein
VRKGHNMKLPDMEAVARKVHEAWMQAKLAQGVQTRKSETGEELMVDYDQLSEEAKELDRGSVRAVYAAIESLQEEKP